MINILFSCLKNATVTHFQASRLEVFHVQVFRLIFDVCLKAEIDKSTFIEDATRLREREFHSDHATCVTKKNYALILSAITDYRKRFLEMTMIMLSFIIASLFPYWLFGVILSFK